jgi:hypothetical protein
MDPQAFIASFAKKHGRTPTHLEVSRELGLSQPLAVKELMQFLKKESSPPTPQESSSETDKPGRRNWLRLGLYLIAAITFILSVYFTGLWFMSMFGLFIAGAISISMVSYMVLSPQAAMRVVGAIKLPLWLTFGIALIFSMGSTVAGQYNKLTENVDLFHVSERATLDLLKTEEQQLVDGLVTYRDQQDFHQRTLESLTSTAEDRMDNYQYAATERNKVAELTQLIGEREERLAAVREEILFEIKKGNIGVTEERADFYSWLASLLGLTRAQVEFLIAALPAIFIDIIAALSLNLAIRLKDVELNPAHPS